MMDIRVPQVYTASEIALWHVSEEVTCGKWRSARPCAFSGLRYFSWRCRIAWHVFTGKYDALNWQGSGDKAATHANYRDILHPKFVRATQ
jgi:hypothetical protein